MNCKVPGKIDHPVLLRRVCGGDNELNPHKTFLFWNQPTPQFLPAEFHRQRSLVATVHGVAKSWTRLKWRSMHAHTDGDFSPWVCFLANTLCLNLVFLWALLFKSEVSVMGCRGGYGEDFKSCYTSSPGEGNGNPLQYSCLENSMDWEAPQSLVGYSPWGRKESDMTERLHFTLLLNF